MTNPNAMPASLVLANWTLAAYADSVSVVAPIGGVGGILEMPNKGPLPQRLLFSLVASVVADRKLQATAQLMTDAQLELGVRGAADAKRWDSVAAYATELQRRQP